MMNLFEHTNAFWAKYAAYEWRVAADGKEYLLPTKDAEAAVYNIMKVADQLHDTIEKIIDKNAEDKTKQDLFSANEKLIENFLGNSR